MKVSRFIHHLSFIILFSLVLIISGCSKANSGDTDVKQVNEAVTPVESSVKEDDGVYMASIKEIDTGVEGFSTYAFSDGDYYYMLFNEYGEGRSNKTYLIEMDSKTGETTGSKTEIDTLGENGYVSQVTAAGEDIIYCSSIFSNNKSDEWLARCKKDGTVVTKKRIREICDVAEENGIYVGLLSDGINTYMVVDGSLLLLDEEFNYKKTLFGVDYLYGHIDNDGVAYFTKNYNGDIASYDPSTGKLNENFANSPNAFHLYGSGDELLIPVGASLKSMDVKTGESIKLFNFLDVNISESNFQDVFRDSEGGIHAIYFKSETDYKDRGDGVMEPVYSTTFFYCDIKRYEQGEAPEVEEIWIACNYLDDSVKKVISEYNLAHPETRVKVKSYWDEYSDYDARVEAFDRDIINRVNYDIVLVGAGDDTRKYSSKGLFDNLIPYIENDSSFDTGKYFEKALFSAKEGDSMYYVPTNVMLAGLEGDKSVFGDKDILSIDDIATARSEYPDIPFLSYGGASNVLFTFLNIDYRLFLGNEDGKYDFTTEAFRNLCEFAALFPEYPEEYYSTYNSMDNISNGKEKLTMANYFGIEPYLVGRALYGKNFKTYGTVSASGNGYYIAPADAYAIMSTSSHKEEAWEIIKALLDAKQDYYGYEISVNRDSFKRNMEGMLIQTRDGFTVYYGENGPGYKLEMTREDMDFFESLMEGATVEKSVDEEVRQILIDEIPHYFNKEKSLEETIKIIQSRVNLYVEENR